MTGKAADADRANQPQSPTPRPPVLVLVDDLFFSTRIADVIHQQNGDPVLVDSPGAFRDGLERWPVLILVDLHALPAQLWHPEVQRAKILPQSRKIPIYGFGSHVDTETLRAARRAGCDHVWARSRFVQELPRLVADHINPPPVYLEGWDDSPSDLFLEGVELFNAGQFYRQHDVFEKHWVEEKRPIRDLYQGILQIGVAFHHVEQGNYRGAIKMLRRGLLRLRPLPPVAQSLDVASLRRSAQAVHDELVMLGPERMSEFDVEQLRAITLDFVGQEPRKEPVR